ncbi:MAG: prepilin-type N-terminal cleavage/methylation domain-containing protein [Pseudomonadota bacterium]|nr:prepilin-type N-terminal cleavage/methylation domain-containing protein [Pseudomonadota bacterium]
MTRIAFCRQYGFTLLELIIALVLLGLLSGVLFGSVKLAGRSTNSGEAKTEAAASMRLAQEFLRTNLEAQHPLRMRKIVDTPLLFEGRSDELRYASELPPRVAGGGIWFYRLTVRADDPHAPLVLERMIPDLSADAPPEFTNADRSILAQGIASLKLGYFGRDPDAGPSVAPSWRDHWSDTQRLPLLIRIDVTPKQGAPWPTLYVSPRESPQAGCHAWDAARERCAAV